ncbi:hypothetical protein KIW84_058186 [Lathyrus oleraceus]|uniref:Uncharacterized protein n=1 Tax=Pisum sativum TaxID=3888 RepID=A0A9D4X396_PEA|nr:hypothetical protein KIW84_058186 [Pisum sativum]
METNCWRTERSTSQRFKPRWGKRRSTENGTTSTLWGILGQHHKMGDNPTGEESNNSDEDPPAEETRTPLGKAETLMGMEKEAPSGRLHWGKQICHRVSELINSAGEEERSSIGELVVIGYTDASFQTDKDDFRSSKQDIIVDSTTEAEYIAASSAEKEAVWIKKFISELGIVPSIMDPIGLYCDNNGAIAQTKKPRSHQRSKDILRRYHLIREIIDIGDVKICRVPTLDNIADPLIKPLAQQKHDGHTRSMGIRGMPDWL